MFNVLHQVPNEEKRRRSVIKCFHRDKLKKSGTSDRIERLHLEDTLRVAEVVPHLGLPVRSTIPTKTHASPGPGGPIPALIGPTLGGRPINR